MSILLEEFLTNISSLNELEEKKALLKKHWEELAPQLVDFSDVEKLVSLYASQSGETDECLLILKTFLENEHQSEWLRLKGADPLNTKRP